MSTMEMWFDYATRLSEIIFKEKLDLYEAMTSDYMEMKELELKQLDNDTSTFDANNHHRYHYCCNKTKQSIENATNLLCLSSHARAPKMHNFIDDVEQIKEWTYYPLENGYVVNDEDVEAAKRSFATLQKTASDTTTTLTIAENSNCNTTSTSVDMTLLYGELTSLGTRQLISVFNNKCNEQTDAQTCRMKEHLEDSHKLEYESEEEEEEEQKQLKLHHTCVIDIGTGTGKLLFEWSRLALWDNNNKYNIHKGNIIGKTQLHSTHCTRWSGLGIELAPSRYRIAVEALKPFVDELTLSVVTTSSNKEQNYTRTNTSKVILHPAANNTVNTARNNIKNNNMSSYQNVCNIAISHNVIGKEKSNNSSNTEEIATESCFTNHNTVMQDKLVDGHDISKSNSDIATTTTTTKTTTTIESLTLLAARCALYNGDVFTPELLTINTIEEIVCNYIHKGNDVKFFSANAKIAIDENKCLNYALQRERQEQLEKGELFQIHLCVFCCGLGFDENFIRQLCDKLETLLLQSDNVEKDQSEHGRQHNTAVNVNNNDADDDDDSKNESCTNINNNNNNNNKKKQIKENIKKNLVRHLHWQSITCFLLLRNFDTEHTLYDNNFPLFRCCAEWHHSTQKVIKTVALHDSTITNNNNSSKTCYRTRVLSDDIATKLTKSSISCGSVELVELETTWMSAAPTWVLHFTR